MKARVFVGDHADGPLFAACDPGARFTQPGVARGRFPAVLSPYATEEAAKAALLRLGATNLREHVR